MQKREHHGARTKGMTQSEINFYDRMNREGLEPDCAGRSEEFVDYTPSEAPSKREARLMCANCPLLLQCKAMTEERKPAWGVWGGHVYSRGQNTSERLLTAA